MAQSSFSGPVKSDAGFIIGSSGSTLSVALSGTVSINPASLAAGASADESVTISGVAVNDRVILNPPTAGLTAGLHITGVWVSAANTVKVRLYNSTGGAIDEAAGTWSYLVIR